MKNVEEKISENINEIFGGKPEKGHRERFAEKLSLMQKPKHKSFISYLKYIATTAAVVAVAFFVFKTEKTEDKSTAFNDVHIAEVKQYYAMQLNDEIDATKELLKNIDEPYRNELLSDIKLMEIDENEIPNTLDNERKTALVVSIYKRKIESLHNLQSSLLACNKQINIK
ncbi:MAG: hypothetical protein LBE11_07410 [Prevotellaceae bacterium]|jgi:hypothetical protein|nr:hypothetical protein [Prevotellaceae bacterium]